MVKEELYVLKVEGEIVALSYDKEEFCKYILNRKIKRFNIYTANKKKEKKFYSENFSDKFIYKCEEMEDDLLTNSDEEYVDKILREEKYKLKMVIETMMQYANEGYYLKDDDKEIIELAIQVLLKKTKPKKFSKFINYDPSVMSYDMIRQLKELERHDKY